MELPNVLPQKRERLFSLDLIRVIAILAVVMIHTCMYYFDFRPEVYVEENFIYGNIFDSIARVGVPLFVMVSGALMLDEQKTLTMKRVLLKNMMTIALLFVVWSILYAFLYQGLFRILDPNYYGLVEWTTWNSLFQAFLNGSFHMWYLYMIAGLYLITPILRVLTKKENARIVAYFIFIGVLVQFIRPLLYVVDFQYPNQLQLIQQTIDRFELTFLSGYVIYYLLGWYLVHVGLPKWARTTLYISGGCSLITIFILTQIYPMKYNITYMEKNVLVLLYSAAVFDLIVHFYKGGPKRNRVLQTLSGLTFGVYIIHMIPMELFRIYIPRTVFPNELLYIFAKWGSVTIITFAVTYGISKIPYVKKIIKG